MSEGDLLAALAQHADEVITATAIGAGIPRAELEEATPDVLVALASRVIEVNAYFFGKAVLPAIETAAQRIAQVSNPQSMTGSSFSVQQA